MRTRYLVYHEAFRRQVTSEALLGQLASDQRNFSPETAQTSFQYHLCVSQFYTTVSFITYLGRWIVHRGKRAMLRFTRKSGCRVTRATMIGYTVFWQKMVSE